MKPTRAMWLATAGILVGLVAAHGPGLAPTAAQVGQPQRIEHFNYGTWETGVMFSQGVSVTNPGR